MPLICMQSFRTFLNYKKCARFTLQRFIHLSPNHSIRKPSSAKKYYSSQRVITNQESTVAGILSHQDGTSSSHSNFYGIEGDEGVIFVNDSKNSEKLMREVLKTAEPYKEFKDLKFGAVRLDSENKPNYYYPSHDLKIFSESDNAPLIEHVHKSNSAYKSSVSLSDDESVSTDHPTSDSDHNPEYSKSVSPSSLKNKKLCDVNFEENTCDDFQSIQKQKSTCEDNSSLNNSNLKVGKESVSCIDEYFFPQHYCKNTELEESNDEANAIDEQYFKEINNIKYETKENKNSRFLNYSKNLSMDQSKDSITDTNNNISMPNDNFFSVSNLEQYSNAFSTLSSELEVRNSKENLLDEQYFKEIDHFKSETKKNKNETYFTNYNKNISMELSKDSVLNQNDKIVQVDNNSLNVDEKFEVSENKVSEKLVSQNYSKNRREMNNSSMSSEPMKNISEENEPMSAYCFVKKLQNTNRISDEIKKGISAKKEKKLDSKGFRILKHQVPTLKYFTRDEILDLLKENVLYQDDDIVVLNKPYNLIIHESKTTRENVCLSNYLDDLAKILAPGDSSPKLLTIHRLDKETTGCLLLARHEISAIKLKSLFAERKVFKTYWIVTSNVPDPMEGIIDIPISEGKIDGKARMVLHPNLPDGTPYTNHSKSGKRAVTSYSVIAVSGNAALIEVKPQTGLKHQIRVHFGFGLGCPILGDHKYSHLDKLAPQKLPSDLLQKLCVRQSKVRHIPLHIHSKHIMIPQYSNEDNLFVTAPLPKHMVENLRSLKFKRK